MKVNVIKKHHMYEKGVQDINDGTAYYLVRAGIAEEYKEPEPEKKPAKKVAHVEEGK